MVETIVDGIKRIMRSIKRKPGGEEEEKDTGVLKNHVQKRIFWFKHT